MAVNFNVQFRINEKTQTRVLRLTDTSTGFTLAKGNFSIVFPDGSTRIKTDFASPDISAAGGFVDIALVTDTTNAVLKGNYKIDFVALDTSLGGYNLSRTFDFNWDKPKNGLTNLTDVLLPEVKFQDATSYSPVGNFTGTLARTLSAAFPSTSEAAAQPAASTVSSNLLDVVYATKYYEGIYNPSSDVSVSYTHSSNSWLTILYVELFTKQFTVRKCPTQLELITKINNYRALIDAYKETNDTQFNILSEQYDLVIALYIHIITRFQTSTQDGSEPQLRELLSILEPYTVSYTYQSTRMLPFSLAASINNSFTISDGVNTDAVTLGDTLLFSSGNPALVSTISNNAVTYNPTFGTGLNTFAQGNDSRFHNPVTIGTANGLSLATQALSLAAATTSVAGAMSASDKSKLDGIPSNANIGTVTSVGLTAPSAFSVTNSPVTGSGTLVLSASGSPLQYITGAGALATLNTTNVPEGTNLYYLDSRSRLAISLTTTGTSGAATYNNSTGVLNIPSYQGNVISFNTRTGAITLTSGDVTTALGFTPYNATNPSGYTTNVGTVTSVGGTGTVSGLTLTGSVTTSGNLTLGGTLALTSGNVTTALGFTPENAANKGAVNGYASLDGGGLVPSSQLPSYVDDVLEFADLASFPATGVTGKIYVALDSNKIYRWSGATYIEVSAQVGTIWGGITGTLSNQVDLQNALDAKQDDLNGTGFVKISGTTISYDNSSYYLASNPSGYTTNVGTVTSVALTVPAAFSVSGTPITGAGTLAITGAGSVNQYIRGDGSLATYNPATGGGGSSKSFYLNGSVAASVSPYLQMSSTPVLGAGTNFTLTNTTGYIAQFLTDVAQPAQLQIPAGNWNFEITFNVSNSNHNAFFYVELYKYNGTTFTLISSSSANPEGLTNGSTVDLYFTSLSVPQTTLTLTDRLAIRVFVNTDGNRTVTMYTENSNLAQVITTFSQGIAAINGLTASVQNLAVGTSGSNFNISSVTDVHTFNLPTASSVNRGALSSADWTNFNSKIGTNDIIYGGTW